MTLRFKKHNLNAVIPTKARKFDVGYDLTAIRLHKILGTKTYMYDTGISITPPNGYYTEIVPRSSIVKTGYVFSNSVGVIDPLYRGTLKICLTKIDESMPDLKLPFRKCQLIIRKFHANIKVKEVKKLSDTSRGDGSFGSTDL